MQEQLLRKDIPFLRSVMPQEFTAILVKGRSNYISLRRLDVAIKKQDLLFQRPEEIDQLVTLRMWSNRTDDGSRSDLDFKPLPSVWEAVQSEDGNCLGRECPRHAECFFFKARRRMRGANVLVVNHALFVTDLALRNDGFGLLPEYQVAVLDEAHTLEAVAGEHMGVQLSSVGMDYSLARLYNARTGRGVLAGHRDALAEAIQQAQKTREVAEDFFNRAATWFQGQPAGFNGRLREPVGWSEFFCEELRRLAGAIERGGKRIEKPEEKIELSAAEERCRSLADQVAHWIRQSAEDAVYWVEVEQKSRLRVRLAAAPLDVGPSLRNLSVHRGRYVRADLGDLVRRLAAPVRLLPVPDRSDRRRDPRPGQPVRLRESGDGAHPQQPARPLRPARRVRARGHPGRRALPRADARQGVRPVHVVQDARGDGAALTPWLASRNITLFSQGDGMPRSKMVNAFKADVNSVIFGVDSFWQGVDVPGEALSNVIITRLPFSVPTHPLLEARLEDIRRRGGNPFVEYQVPEAVIKLKQGFGRLIRTRSDRGIVVILDPRVLTKPYGRTFLNSLPDCPRIVETPALGQIRL